MKKALADGSYELWILLAQTRDLMYKARRQELTKHNISPRQSAALFIVQSLGEEATPVEIARHLVREHHSVTELLSRMEKDGLLRKVKDLDKKGRVKIVLTEKGQQTYHESLKRDSIREIMSCLSEEERHQLQSALRKIRNKALKIVLLKELPFP